MRQAALLFRTPRMDKGKRRPSVGRVLCVYCHALPSHVTLDVEVHNCMGREGKGWGGKEFFMHGWEEGWQLFRKGKP